MPEEVLKFYLFDIVSLIKSYTTSLKSQDEMSFYEVAKVKNGKNHHCSNTCIYISSCILATSYITW